MKSIRIIDLPIGILFVSMLRECFRETFGGNWIWLYLISIPILLLFSVLVDKQVKKFQMKF
jgi:hypothetical protein